MAISVSVYLPFVRPLHRSPLDSPHKGLVLWKVIFHVVALSCPIDKTLAVTSFLYQGVFSRKKSHWIMYSKITPAFVLLNTLTFLPFNLFPDAIRQKILIWWNTFHNTRRLCREASRLVDFTWQWRHNERDGVSNDRRLDCLLNHLFRRRSKKISKLRVTGLCEWNSPVIGGFPSQRASNAEMVPCDDVIMTCKRNWTPIMPTLSTLTTPEVVVMTTSGAASDDMVGSWQRKFGYYSDVAWLHGVSNHRHIKCLFNRLLRLTSKEASKFRITDHVW